jgi:REP element-mobilizing transposase RayT
MRRWIAEVQHRYGTSIGIQVSMPGHVHLVVETPRGSRALSETLKFVCSKIALEVNRAFGLSGPLFEERFWSRVVSSMSDLVRTIRYIAENPVKARLVTRAADWLASSIRDFHHGDARGLWTFRGYFFAKLDLPGTMSLASPRPPAIIGGGGWTASTATSEVPA